MEFSTVIQTRYSVRQFKDTHPTPQQLEQIINAGLVAPTATNAQPFKIFNITSDEAKNHIRQSTKYHFDAPAFLLVCAQPEKGWTRGADNAPFCDVDASIVATHMMLETHNIGLGTTWVASIDTPLLQELEPQLAGLHIVALFPIGYPADSSHPSARHTQCKPYEELVKNL